MEKLQSPYTPKTEGLSLTHSNLTSIALMVANARGNQISFKPRSSPIQLKQRHYLKEINL